MRKDIRTNPKIDAKSYRQLSKNRPLNVKGYDFSDMGWFHARSIFGIVLIGKKLAKTQRVGTNIASAEGGGRSDLSLPSASPSVLYLFELCF